MVQDGDFSRCRWLFKLLLLTNSVLFFLEITLMEADPISDDLVDSQTFDLSCLELDKVYYKTFIFRQVNSLKHYVIFYSRFGLGWGSNPSHCPLHPGV